MKIMVGSGTKPRLNNQDFPDGVFHLECNDALKRLQRIMPALSFCGWPKFTIVKTELCRSEYVGYLALEGMVEAHLHDG